jgi:hypothetical protein
MSYGETEAYLECGFMRANANYWPSVPMALSVPIFHFKLRI